MLNGWETTFAPAPRASSAVPSLDPSSTTSTSKPGADLRQPATTAAMERASFQAGMTMSCRGIARRYHLGHTRAMADVRRAGRRRRSAAIGRCVAAVVLVALASCRARDTPPNVVLISVDTMRADRLGLAGYPRATTPNIDRFFGERGRLYSRSYSTEA